MTEESELKEFKLDAGSQAAGTDRALSYLFYLAIERPSQLLTTKIRITPNPKNPKPLAL
jgi:hypothetical protein